MKHLSIELSAIDEIIAERSLQSVEFSHGQWLTNFLRGESDDPKLPQSLLSIRAEDGTFIVTRRKTDKPKYLIIDLDVSGMFRDLGNQDTLFVFQKTLRFAKKMWHNLSLTYSERLIAGSSKAVLFPFEFRPDPYRIVIEREPMVERLSKRGHKGDFYLLFKAGFGGGDPQQEPSYTVFRKVYEALPQAVERARTAAATLATDGSAAIDQLRVEQLDSLGDAASPTMLRRFEQWMPLLTENQRRFVSEPIAGSYRIEGPAGTGKTLSLILKALYALRQAKARDQDLHLAFVTHSDATKNAVLESTQVIDSDGFTELDRLSSAQSLKICTLNELCAEQLRQTISEQEFLDRDALESKELQRLYISEAIDEVLAAELSTHERFMSPELVEFFRNEQAWNVAALVQHEISVVIKGRASDNLDAYKQIPPLKYGLPIKNEGDKAFIFIIFRRYDERLSKSSQFDTDDVVITTIGQLDTPIWRRRRQRQGYDAIFVDETHLFNINEIHLFHYFTRKEGPYPIIYSVDRSQAVGDRGWTTAEIAQSVSPDLFTEGSEKTENVKTIFRSSPDVINLAFSIVSSGATLFTNFDNPLDMASSGFTELEESLASKPLYMEVLGDEKIIEAAFAAAEEMVSEMKARRGEILVVGLDDNLVEQARSYAQSRNKPVAILKRRGDLQAVEGALKSGQLVLAHADFVGGLEFQGVVLFGIDEGRVPPTSAVDAENSRRFLSYAAHNRLYVAITRAKYRVIIIADSARGPSKIIEPALTAGVLSKVSA